jgi:hydroxymethylpyrimidine/phosphomethylpyrimidine kinase
MHVALTIAGSDSGGGAGIQADLKTFAARGVFGTSVITAITAQNTVGVQGVLELPAEIIAQQFDSVCSDFPIDAAKTGMLSSVEIIEVVAAKIKQWNIKKLVVDPVMVAKSGDPLLRDDAIEAFIEKILPLAYIITPNIPEAEVLSGVKIREAHDRTFAEQEIRNRAWTARGEHEDEFYIVIKGGHQIEGGTAGDETVAPDLLYDGEFIFPLNARRIHSKNTHGTGCTFSAAICAELAKGASTHDAVKVAKEYITRAIAQAPHIGHGHGPLQHFPT